jgi:YesN/AraC family two-component response regulator
MPKKAILLVESDVRVRGMLKDCLKKQYLVHEATNCREAKRLPGPVDLAVIAYRLPDGDGFDVIDLIKKRDPGMPIILISAYATYDLIIKAFRSGVVDFIRKPFSLRYLLGKISETLEGKKSDLNLSSLESRDEFIMEGIAAFIEENFREQLTLDRVSRVAHMTKFRFCRSFKKRFGISFVTYLNQTRIKNSLPLLGNSYASITDIAFSLGFKSVQYFNRVFRQTTGTSPTGYRTHLKRPTSKPHL